MMIDGNSEPGAGDGGVGNGVANCDDGDGGDSDVDGDESVCRSEDQ